MRILTNRWIHFFILFALLMAAVFYSSSEHPIRKRLQYVTFDQFNKMHPREKSDQTVIVDLDEASILKIGQWPWPRDVMADLTRRLTALGAKVISYDIVFAESDRTSPMNIVPDLEGRIDDDVLNDIFILADHDEAFGRAIEESQNVVMGFTRARAKDTRYPPALIKPMQIRPADKEKFMDRVFAAPGVAANLPVLTREAAGNGSFMATPDIDGIIREVSLFVRFPPKPGSYGWDELPEDIKAMEPQLYPMLGIEALRVARSRKALNQLVPNKADDKSRLTTEYLLRVGQHYNVPVEADGKMWVYYRDIRQDEYIPAHQILDPAFEDSIGPKIRGKIVFVGTSAEGLRDIRSTPLDVFIPGVEVHVNVVEQILQGNFLRRPDLIVGAEAIAILASGVLIILLAPFVGAVFLALLSLGVIGGAFYGSWFLYVEKGILFDPVYLSLSVLVIFLVSTLLTYIRTEADRRQVRDAFGLYISPDFMKELTKNPDKLKLGGETKDLTIMFTDIRSFTSICEGLSPEEIIQLMNDFLTPMSDLVMQNRGTIDKYMGDAMMAFWNAPLDDENHERHACLAALGMQEALAPINENVRIKAEKIGKEPVLLRAGIGINTGPCAVGNMGSKQRFAYSTLGDAVNLASRLEGQTKTYGVNILIGHSTWEKVQDFATLEMDLIRVKGKIRPEYVYGLFGDEAAAQKSEFLNLKDAHDQMIRAYRSGEFNEVVKLAKECKRLEVLGLGVFYDLYAERGRKLSKNPPENWDGVFEATTK